MNVDPKENQEWFLLGGAAAGALVALVAGPQQLVGVAVGAVLGLAFAPKPGCETRRDFGEWARRVSSETMDFLLPSTNWKSAEIPPQPSQQAPSAALPKTPG